MIVGIGASAGGLQAFKTFFSHMPADSDLAFVLVQHLAPDHDSMLVELLGRATEMPVVQAEDGMAVQLRHVYVIPPNATLTIAEGRLKVATPAPPRDHRWPINTFFTSLAEDQGDCAVCVVLAGAGSDGALGLRAVKDHGGLTLAQSGFDHAALTGMPASAAATGLVDDVMPVEKMPERLMTYQRQMLVAHERKGSDGVRRDMGPHLQSICKLLFAEVGHDFSQYKQKTLMRRIQRRMLVVQTETEEEYVDYLKANPNESRLLFREFLIGVTDFFRDPEALEALATKAIPLMLKDKTPADVVRIWVAGCSTGQEAYSIAMLLREQLGSKRAPKVQIFATDIDDESITAARAGQYPAPLKGVSQERRERWFHKEGDSYQVAKQIREMCIFSAHNVTSDPPFSRMDLVSCRNLLIYMNAELQQRLVQAFHYALRNGGFLLLGTSEHLTRENAGLFKELDKKQRLYVRCEGDNQRPRLPETQRSRMAHRGYAAGGARIDPESHVDQQVWHVLEAHSPAYVVINAEHEVLRFGGDSGRYLAPASGIASLDLFQLLDRSLRAGVREAVLQVFASGEGVTRDGLSFADRDGQDHPLRLIVEPLPGTRSGQRLCVVAFSALEHVRGATGSAEDIEPGSEGARIKELEDELRATRSQLDTAVDMHESASEELKSANEEYQSVNEELQSANEELETSTEEMQSINEELQVVNTELNNKNEQLNRTNDDIRNLLNSTQIAVVFLDEDLHIRNFTPAMANVFHLREGDKGRPLTEISPRIDYSAMRDDVAQVLHDDRVVERVLNGAGERPSFLLRMRRYVTAAHDVDGVVLTFVDITQSQRRNREARRAAAIINASRDAILGVSLDGRITSWNPSAEHLFGVSREHALESSLALLRPSDPSDPVNTFFDDSTRDRASSEFEMTWVRPDGTEVPLEVSYSRVHDDEDTLIAGTLVVRDVTERHRAHQHTRMMLRELDHRVKNTLTSVQAIAEQTLVSAPDMQAFKTSFMARLMALSSTHNLLAQDAWNGATLADLMDKQLAPYRLDDGAGYQLSGKRVVLSPKQALALSMALHELATNAGKYGALSVPAGQVAVQWTKRSVDHQTRLHLRWTETGGPAVTPPKRKGFGSRLIRDGLAYELDGEVSLEFPASGVICSIDIPLD